MKKTILAVLAVGMMIILATGAFAFNTVSAKTIFSASSDTAITQKVKLNDAIVIQKSEDKPVVQGAGELDRKTADEITGLFEDKKVFADESATFSGSASGGASGGSAAGYAIPDDETFSGSATAVAEIASGKSAAIRTTKITSAKLFGFIPMPWKKAVEVQVIEGNSIAEKTISEGSEETIGNYNVAVGKIVSEEEIEISVTQSEETITALEVASSTLSGNAIAEVSAGGAAAGVAKTSKARSEE